MSDLINSKEWKALKEHFNYIRDKHMKDMFNIDKDRFKKFHIKFDDILFDYSKNIINSNTINLLLDLANYSDLKKWIERIFSGEKINFTENRAVLHSALRDFDNNEIKQDGWLVSPMVNTVRNHIKNFVESIHNGTWLGCTGESITDIVNIGIGGSDLGPQMVCEALKPYAVEGMNVYFVSNVDGSHISDILKKVNPAKTLFVIASKTFTTQETITNAITAKNWFLKKIANHESDIEKHFIALSTNEKAVKEFGIPSENMFIFWDWVGGRYSLWSAIGISIALYIGYSNFEELLKGGNDVDLHFKNEPFERNIPVIMALLGIWYNNFFNAHSYAIIPYDQNLDKFPDFLQQLDMESNGKFVDRDGCNVDYRTGPVIWGRAGTNAQHSFFQLIHQGTQLIPADFIAPIFSNNNIGEHHKILLSNFFAQTEALMKGKTKEEVELELNKTSLSEFEKYKLLPHKIFKGNKPTNTILIERITPRSLGKLIAIYEHKVFVQGIIWRINSFDQWGVELGKQLAKNILPELDGNNLIESHDSSTNNLINYYKKVVLRED